MLKRTMTIAALIGVLVAMGPMLAPALGKTKSGVDKASLNKLVQQLMDARTNYGESLHRLIEYYKKVGNAQGENWARRELKGFEKIRQREYLSKIKGRLTPVNQAALAQSDLVEALVGYRLAYRQSLETLVNVLEGAKDVKSWIRAKRELKELISVNKYLYLRDADTPGAELRPAKKIAAAEKLYKEAMKIKKKSKRLNLVRRYETQLAIEGFRRLIRDYPNSDRIDDAAYQIAELCQNNLKDYRRAIRWYECIGAWDADSPLRANLRIAQLYDKQVVNRLTALDYYRRALDTEARGSSERRSIERRIKRLSGK